MSANRTLLRLFSACLAIGVALPAFAQVVDNRDIAERMDKLEHDIMVVQRQVARNGGENTGGSDMPPGDENAASTQVQLSAIQDELRKLRGRIEENEFQMRKLSETMDKFQKDTDFRLNDLAAKAAAPTPPASTPAPTAKAEASHEAPPHVDTSAEAHPAADSDNAAEDAPGKTTAGDGALHTPGESDSIDTPRDHYNYAFRLLNQTRYEEAATSFKQFTGKYPKDPLIGNAYYWLGETFYIRHDYVQAADNFRQGFEVLPNGPKAADNLLKLSMSLSAMDKTKDACVVLDQLRVKFKETSPSVVQKADAERSRIGCR